MTAEAKPQSNIFNFDLPSDPPFEMIPVEPTGEHALPQPFRDSILVQTLHDGQAIPREYRLRPDGSSRIPEGLLRYHYVQERDWGANLVASKIASALGLESYGRVRIARVLVDFNRFPGSTPASNSSFLDRQAINPPFATVLDHEEKMTVLEQYYDHTSDFVEQHIGSKMINVVVHTYDERNASHTRRPDISLITLPRNYLHEARMPYGVFDPMFPDELAETTCSPILRDRISLNLERCGFRVAHNHPYPATEGSLDVRSQVWFFFVHLKKRFEAANPETVSNDAYRHVWKLLLNTNLRKQEGQTLFSYLHRYRMVPAAQKSRFQRAREAYEHVARFLVEQGIASSFSHTRNRPNSLSLEVRKDLLCTIDPQTQRPRRASRDQVRLATLIGKVVASAISTYFETDRPAFMDDDTVVNLAEPG